jgi:16S rRNA processing protein RimM
MVRVKSFTATPEDLGAYGDLCDISARRHFRLRVMGTAPGKRAPDVLLAQIDGITDRDTAESLRGLRLYIPRSRLPELEAETYYHADLIGLTVITLRGEDFGMVRSVQDYGAGELLEIERPDHTTLFLPFNHAAVPEVRLAKGQLVIDPSALDFASADRDREGEN